MKINKDKSQKVYFRNIIIWEFLSDPLLSLATAAVLSQQTTPILVCKAGTQREAASITQIVF